MHDIQRVTTRRQLTQHPKTIPGDGTLLNELAYSKKNGVKSICSANEGQVRGIRNILLVCIVLVGFSNCPTHNGEWGRQCRWLCCVFPVLALLFS